jgi:hypothetical protein
VTHRAGGIAAALVIVIGLAACGGSDDAATPAREGRTTTTERDDPAPAYVGLSKADAIAQAEADDRPWRIGREDDEQFALTQDFIEDRVTFEIDDGTVTTATLG